ncbi:MAG: endonuclease/exonuclease/phosphatase family protein [Methylotenera sp.]|nr:endonuclease/exonuclease/phosphatase family protein [Methylotenera sp.]
MRVVSWNCNGAFRKKFGSLDYLQADILIIQECEDPQKSKDASYINWASNHLWTGNNKNSGLGVFAKNNTTLKLLNWESLGLELFIPFLANDQLTILAVWTKQANSPTFQYIGQLWKYLQAHQSKLSPSQAILCGDFNSNACWDKWDRWWNHSDVVKDLAKLNIYSAYHLLNKIEQGQENTPTFYMNRNLAKPYHIDYAFASSTLLTFANLNIGEPDEWLSLSDHMPLIFDIN